jgi:hypothetical protein
MAMQDEQRLKDLLRNIETGDIPEDLPDPEDYDDMGGIKSLDRGAPSIKMASETGEEEFGLELDSLYYEFLDAVKKGYGGSFEDYARDYFSKKQTKDADRKMAMFGGRMQYADGMKGLPPEVEALLEGMKPDKKQYAPPFEKGPSILPQGRDFKFNELIDKNAEDEYYRKKAIELDKKYNPQNYPDTKEGVSKPKIDLTPGVVEKLKKLLKKREEEAKKLAKGGIAGVL